METLIKKTASALFALIALSMIGATMNIAIAAKPAPAPTVSPLATDLQTLLAEANALNTQLAGINLAADNICGPLISASQSSSAHIDNIASVDSSLSAPLTLDADILTALENLSATYVSLGSEAVRISSDLNALSNAVDQLNMAEGISLVLALSDDIGTMANRIGEMADRILVMSDNIGAMADNIILTQQIQNANVDLTLQNILTAQTNVVNLVAQLDTSIYNLDLLSQLDFATLLEGDMSSLMLTAENVATELANLIPDVASLKTQIETTSSVIDSDSINNTMVVNEQSMITLMGVSSKVAALATAVEGYAIAVDGLNATSQQPTLADSVNSILVLSSDIGTMANRIGSEADQILEMADNIGMQATAIVATQQLQSLNVAATQTALLNAQVTMINLIVAYGL
jgi:hypothetical protein